LAIPVCKIWRLNPSIPSKTLFATERILEGPIGIESDKKDLVTLEVTFQRLLIVDLTLAQINILKVASY
jgi:hypothetical protein